MKMLKFTEFIFEEVGIGHKTLVAADQSASGYPSDSPKIEINSIKNIEEIVKKYPKKTKQVDNSNGVNININSNIILKAKNGYEYNLIYSNKYVNQVPYFFLSGVGTTIDPVVEENSAINNFKIIPDKYYQNVSRIFQILDTWKNQISSSTSNVNASTVYNFDDFMFESEVATITQQPKQSSIVNNQQSKQPVNQTKQSVNNQQPTITVDNFLNYKLSSLRGSQFKNLPDYNEVLATLEMLLGNPAKNMKSIIDDILVRDFVNMSGIFKKASEAKNLKTLWYIKIKTLNNDKQYAYKNVKFNTIIKPKDNIKICKLQETGKAKVEIKIDEVQSVRENK